MPSDADRSVLVVLRVEDGHRNEPDELRAFLRKDEILGGHLRLRAEPIPPEALGGGDVLAVAVEHGSLVVTVTTALATALVGFLKFRGSDISATVVTPDATVTFEAVRVRGKEAADLQRALAELLRKAGVPPAGSAGDA